MEIEMLIKALRVLAIKEPDTTIKEISEGGFIYMNNGMVHSARIYASIFKEICGE